MSGQVLERLPPQRGSTTRRPDRPTPEESHMPVDGLPFFNDAAEVRAYLGEHADDVGDLELYATRSRMVHEMIAAETAEKRRVGIAAIKALDEARKAGYTAADLRLGEERTVPSGDARLRRVR